MTYTRAVIAAALGFLTLSGCQPYDSDKLASARVVKLGKEHLVLQDNGHVMFLSVDEHTKRHLYSLKKGEEVTLLGKKDTVETSPGSTRQASEVYAIIKEDGTRIALR